MCASFKHAGPYLCRHGAYCRSQILKLQLVKSWAFLPSQRLLASNANSLPYSRMVPQPSSPLPFLAMKPTMASPCLPTPCPDHMENSKRFERPLSAQLCYSDTNAFGHTLNWGSEVVVPLCLLWSLTIHSYTHSVYATCHKLF